MLVNNVTSVFGDRQNILVLLILLWAIGGSFYAFYEGQVFVAYLTDPSKTANPLTMLITLILGAESIFGALMVVSSVGLWTKKPWAKQLATLSPIMLCALLATSILVWIKIHLDAGVDLFQPNYWNSYQIWAFSLPQTTIALVYSLVGVLTFKKSRNKKKFSKERN